MWPLALDRMSPRARWSTEDGAMILDPSAPDDISAEENEKNTMREYARAASDQISCLNFTWDAPACNQSKAMPVLDTQMWMGYPEEEEQVPKPAIVAAANLLRKEEKFKAKPRSRTKKKLILYKFYRKPMACKVPNLASNALPEQQKVTNATQEVIRRLKTTSRDIRISEIEEILGTYMGELEAGGYSMKWRIEVLQAALTGYGRMWLNEVIRGKPINRPEASTRTKRRAAALTGNRHWYKGITNAEEEDDRTKQTSSKRPAKGKHRKHTQPHLIPEGVLFVPHTPGGQLKKRLQEVEDNALATRKAGRIKMVERGGDTILSKIGNPAPWKSMNCGRPGCKPCTTKEGSCRELNVTYKITCIPCKEAGKPKAYIGETHRAFGDRTAEHSKALEDKDRKNALVKHWLEDHSGEEAAPQYSWEIVKKHKTSLERQIWEALHISNTREDALLNSKTEWGQNPIPRTVVNFLDSQLEEHEHTHKGESNGQVPQAAKRQRHEEEEETHPANRETEKPSGDFHSQYKKRKKRLKMALEQIEYTNSAKRILEVPEALQSAHWRPLTAPQGPPAGPHLDSGHGQSNGCPTEGGVRDKAETKTAASATASWGTWLQDTNQNRAKLEEQERKRREKREAKLAEARTGKRN